MSLALLVVNDTDASVFGGITRHFDILNRSVLALLPGPLSVSLPAYEPFFIPARGSDGGMYSDITATEQN